MDVSRVLQVDVHWLLCSAAKVTEYVTGLQRCAHELQLQLIQVSGEEQYHAKWPCFFTFETYNTWKLFQFFTSLTDCFPSLSLFLRDADRTGDPWTAAGGSLCDFQHPFFLPSLSHSKHLLSPLLCRSRSRRHKESVQLFRCNRLERCSPA